jgi:CubicO group peptidase (beta-lactamase class C family)
MPDGPPAQSDPRLLAKLHDVAGIVAGRLAVAVVDLNSEPPVRFALVRCTTETAFEIGSITKALTGMLLADLVHEGRLSLDTPVGLVASTTEGTDLGSVTLMELATHTSGLPRMPRGGAGTFRAVPYALAGRNPYRSSPMSVIELATGQQLHDRGQRRYSNIGGAVLGEILATALSTDYPSLLAQRLLLPLEMEATGVSVKGNTAPWARSSMGLPREPWVLRGYAPAGGVFSTIEDMARLASRLLDGSAPGLAATYPIEGVHTDRPNRRTGLFWIIDGPPEQIASMTWHNGGTGGYSSFLALMPDTGQAVIALQSVAGRSQRLQRMALGLTV